MTNHFRTLLLNLSYGDVPSEHIPREFTARQLSGELFSIHQILFPSGTSRDDRKKLCLAYLELVRGAGLDTAFTLVDDRITYELNTDFNHFGEKGIDLTGLYSKLNSRAETIDQIFRLPAIADATTYENLWRKHPNIAYKIAGLIVAFVLRLS